MGILDSLFGKKRDWTELKDQGAIVIDVRSPQEFASGHPDGAKNIPLPNINNEVNHLKSEGKPIILCCASGMRSGQATSILKQNGIEAYNAGSWTNLN